MPFTNDVSRSDASALIPEEVVDAVITKATEQSATLSLFRKIPVNRAQQRIPILSALPLAYWVTGDTGQKQTTELAWKNKFMNIEEIAVILPIPNNVADDVEYNIWDEAEPLIAESIGRTLDSAVFFGVNAPSSFPQDLLDAATAAGNVNTMGDLAATGGFFGDFDETLALVEASGYDYNGVVTRTSTKSKFRAARSTLGERLDQNRIASDLKEIDGEPILYTMRGLWPTTAQLFVGDFSQFVVGLRKDVTMEMFREGVIQDNTGAIVFNLLQQDMSALRVTFRAGWQVANPINYEQQVEADRYPAAILNNA